MTHYSAPTGFPGNVMASTTSRNVTVSWDPIECSERNGVITGYVVELDGTSIGMVTSPDRTFTATGLTPHANYTFRVAGVNSHGTGPYTDVIFGEDSKYLTTN